VPETPAPNIPTMRQRSSSALDSPRMCKTLAHWRTFERRTRKVVLFTLFPKDLKISKESPQLHCGPQSNFFQTNFCTSHFPEVSNSLIILHLRRKKIFYSMPSGHFQHKLLPANKLRKQKTQPKPTKSPKAKNDSSIRFHPLIRTTPFYEF
jgi:hypothetical protein